MILTLIAAAAISASCAWDAPRGLHAITAVPPSSLVDNYRDIPASTREKLKARMDALKFDDVAEIRKTSIRGEYAYTDLRDMHFGASGQKVCREVSLAKWTPEENERALIYCEDGHCIAAPTICRNVSRITRGPRLNPPKPLALEIPPAEIDPLPVVALAPIPEIEPGPLTDDYTPQTFSRLSVPNVPQTVPQDRYERISADLTFWDGWARPILWDGPGIVQRVTVPSAPIVVNLPPVPGVNPPMLVSDKPVTVPALPTKPVYVPDDAPDSVAPVPEPGTWGLMLGGLLGVWVMVRRRSAR